MRGTVLAIAASAQASALAKVSAVGFAANLSIEVNDSSYLTKERETIFTERR